MKMNFKGLVSLHQFTTFINDSPFVGQGISGLS